jgi:hypothetical protein
LIDLDPPLDTDPAGPIRIFVSSAFTGMEDVREQLMRRVFPRLRALCSERGRELVPIDLRWGVPTRDHEIIRICLDEVESCQPFFVGIVGDRHGSVLPLHDEILARRPWLREYAGASVAEIEIRCVLRRGPHRARYSQFYLWKGDENERVRQLKADILTSGFPVRSGFDTAEQLGEQVYADIRSTLDHVAPVTTHDARTRHLHAAFVRRLARDYIAQPEVLDFLDRHADGDGPPLLLVGAPGVGKSTSIAAWAEHYRRQHPDIVIAQYVAGLDEDGLSARTCLQRLIAELAELVYAAPSQPCRLPDAELAAELSRLVQNVAPSRRVVITIDGIDRMDRACIWWLASPPPPRVRVVLSACAVPGYQLAELYRWRVLSLRAMTLSEAQAMVNHALRLHGRRECPPRLVLADGTYNPACLRTVIAQGLLCGDREKLDARLPVRESARNGNRPVPARTPSRRASAADLAARRLRGFRGTRAASGRSDQPRHRSIHARRP